MNGVYFGIHRLPVLIEDHGPVTGLFEESVGSLLFAKDIVAEVLTLRVKRGVMTQELALEIVERILRDNAIGIYKLRI